MSNEFTLPLLLKQLGLPMMLSHWKDNMDKAVNDRWSHAKYLASLCELEVAARQQKRIQRHVVESKLLVGKTIDNFNFKKAKSINSAQIQALADDTAWTRQAKNVVLFGPSGVGKSHLACAIGYRLIEQGVRVLFTPATLLVQKLQKARQELRLAEVLAKLARIPVLILDDLSYVKKSELETSVLFELIADRYESNSLIITSNQPFGEWDQVFPDTIMAVAAVDRLIHHATIINIDEESYRKSSASSLN